MSRCASPLACLLDVFSSLTCTRCKRGLLYPLDAMLALILVAVLSGCKNLTQISVFAQNRLGLLKRLGLRPVKYPRKPESKGRIRAPSEDTLGRILAAVSPSELNEALAGFLAERLGVPRRAVRLLRGEKSRRKTFSIALPPAAIARIILSEACAPDS